jgi:hypothetical protein
MIGQAEVIIRAEVQNLSSVGRADMCALWSTQKSFPLIKSLVSNRIDLLGQVGFKAVQHAEKEHTKREKGKTNREWTRIDANKKETNRRLTQIHADRTLRSLSMI